MSFMHLYQLSLDEVFKRLKADEKGLSESDVRQRQKEFGKNQLKDKKEVSAWRLLLNQFKDFLVLILLGAAIISYISGSVSPSIGGRLDAVLIMIILLINIIFGFLQNYKAEKSISELRKMSPLKAWVLREGKRKEVDAAHLVPGDIIFLEEGVIVPADARLIEGSSLTVDESSLTGESIPITKKVKLFSGSVPLGDRKNMVHMSTSVVRGSGKAMVTAIGMETEMGSIAGQLNVAVSRLSPFQNELNQLAKRIGWSVLFLSLLIVGVQVAIEGLSLANFLPIFIFGASLAVAAVPEGLPAVMTVCLALSSKKMAKENALVRQLSVVESLGSVDVICTDKTGTLTENIMTVQRLWLDQKEICVSGLGYRFKGEFKTEGELPASHLRKTLICGALCNNADVEEGKKVSGDPTEAALLVSAYKYGIKKNELKTYERIDEHPFSSDRKMMSVICLKNNQKILFAKGATENILNKCSFILEADQVNPLTSEKRQMLMKANEALTSQALRVLGFAYQKDTSAEEDLVFLGLQAMIDPPRKEVFEAIKQCNEAGIRVIMMTGDHPGTAAAIAHMIGLKTDTLLTGSDLDRLSEGELAQEIKKVNVFARLSSSHKTDLLNVLQQNHLVAMTGDGVNDAPALHLADVGIAMGQSGTAVARQASDMILLDDNFATILSAVRHGRGVFDNIQKFVSYLLSANIGEVVLVFLSLIYGKVILAETYFLLPLLATHLLWINLLTDGLPALALALDPARQDIMKTEPKSKKEGIITRSLLHFILISGFSLGLIAFIVFIFYVDDMSHARSLVFTTLVVLELAKIEHIRSEYQLSFFSNYWLIAAILASLILQMIVLYTPLSAYFHVIPLNLSDWTIIVVALVSFLIVLKGMDYFKSGINFR